MSRNRQIDTDLLQEDVRNKLQGIIKQTRVFELRPEDIAPPAPNIPDVFHYKISIKDDRESISLSFDDTNVPQQIRPLLEWLMDF